MTVTGWVGFALFGVAVFITSQMEGRRFCAPRSSPWGSSCLAGALVTCGKFKTILAASTGSTRKRVDSQRYRIARRHHRGLCLGRASRDATGRLKDGGMTNEWGSLGQAALRRVCGLALHVIIACAVALQAIGLAIETAGSAEAGEPGTLSVAIHVSSDGNRCYDPGLVAAIRHFMSRYAEQVNASGGIHGLSLKPVISDDFESADRTTANVAKALQDPATIAMLGVPSSTRGRKVFEKLGDDIRNVAIPFITEKSLDEIFADAPNVFTMASSVGNELRSGAPHDCLRRVCASGVRRP